MERNRASLVYGVLDLVFAGLYLYVFLKLVPSRSGLFTAVAVAVSLVNALGGAGMFLAARWAKRVALAASLIMLAACFALVLLLALSAAYLHGIYDGVGQAGAAIAILAALVAIEAVGLLPALQLAHLWRRRQALRQSA